MNLKDRCATQIALGLQRFDQFPKAHPHERRLPATFFLTRAGTSREARVSGRSVRRARLLRRNRLAIPFPSAGDWRWASRHEIFLSGVAIDNTLKAASRIMNVVTLSRRPRSIIDSLSRSGKTSHSRAEGICTGSKLIRGSSKTEVRQSCFFSKGQLRLKHFTEALSLPGRVVSILD